MDFIYNFHALDNVKNNKKKVNDMRTGAPVCRNWDPSQNGLDQ